MPHISSFNHRSAFPGVANLGSTVYERLPVLRTVLASLWGYRLNRLRYGPETDGLVEQIREREVWSLARWKAWQEERLAEVLQRAATQVPYYRALWRQRRMKGDRSSWEVLANWPVLEKSELRQAPEGFLADDCAARTLHHVKTSGTTGSPLDFWMSTATIRTWYAMVEARWRQWSGITRHSRWAALGAQMVAPVKQKRPPFWVFNRGLNQLYMSTYHISPSTTPLYLDAMREHEVRYVWGHSSAIHMLALAIERQGLPPLPLDVVLSSSEPLLKAQRARIGAAFQAPVRETYGMTEMAAAASECEHGALHLWPDVGCYEYVSGNEPAKPGVAAELISTLFLQDAMPLVRYRTGDMVRSGGEDGPACPCGRTLPILRGLAGRTSDVLYAPDGRQITPSAMEIVFDTDLGIAEAQIVQEKLARIRVCYVPAPQFRKSDENLIRARVIERMGDVQVVVEAVPSIPRGPNGKFQAVRCLLTLAEIAAVGRPC